MLFSDDLKKETAHYEPLISNAEYVKYMVQ